MEKLKKIPKIIKKNMLLCLIILLCIVLWIYGLILSKAGYMFTGNSEDNSYIALALTELGEGIYPWNMNDNNLNDFGFVETISLEDSAFITADEYYGADFNQDGDNNGGKTAPVEYVVGKVPVTYFDDAVFIGDSRMEGVYEFAGLGNATFLTKVSMSIYTMMDSKVSNPDYKTVLEGLTARQYGKVYIMVGINEIGTANTEYFVRHYQDVIHQIRQLQPKAIIVIQAIMHVTASRDATDVYFNNANINERNEGLKTLADGKHIFYIDVNEVYDDENGNLIEEYSSDTIHLYGNKYGEWREFLLDHGIYRSDIDPFEEY